jgi:hypothetical protein
MPHYRRITVGKAMFFNGLLIWRAGQHAAAGDEEAPAGPQ